MLPEPEESMSVEEYFGYECCEFCKYYKKLTTNDNFGKCLYPYTPEDDFLRDFSINLGFLGGMATQVPITHKGDWCEHYNPKASG